MTVVSNRADGHVNALMNVLQGKCNGTASASRDSNRTGTIDETHASTWSVNMGHASPQGSRHLHSEQLYGDVLHLESGLCRGTSEVEECNRVLQSGHQRIRPGARRHHSIAEAAWEPTKQVLALIGMAFLCSRALLIRQTVLGISRLRHLYALQPLWHLLLQGPKT